MEEQTYQFEGQSKTYESLVMSTLLYGAELWPLSAVQKKNKKAQLTQREARDSLGI